MRRRTRPRCAPWPACNAGCHPRRDRSPPRPCPNEATGELTWLAYEARVRRSLRPVAGVQYQDPIGPSWESVVAWSPPTLIALDGHPIDLTPLSKADRRVEHAAGQLALSVPWLRDQAPAGSKSRPLKPVRRRGARFCSRLQAAARCPATRGCFARPAIAAARVRFGRRLRMPQAGCATVCRWPVATVGLLARAQYRREHACAGRRLRDELIPEQS